MSDKRLNILLIVTDQEQSWNTLPDDLSLPGHERLRAQGMSFDRFHVNCSPCGPSRSNMYTGYHTQQTHMHVNPDNAPHPSLPKDIPTIGHLLRQAGYQTLYKGKWHLSRINAGRDWQSENPNWYEDASDALEDYGFSDYNFFGEVTGYAWDGYRHDGAIAGLAAKSFRELASQKDEQPWFMAVNFVNPHDIMFYDATGKQNDTRVLKNFICPLVGAPGDDLYQQDLGYDMPESFYHDQIETKPEIQTAIRQRQKMMYGDLPLTDVENWRRFRNYYLNCIRDVDRHLETVLDALEDAGLADDTIVIYTADHGERAGAHGMQQKAGTVYEEETNIPFIVAHPQMPSGVSTQALAGMVDIVPTLLSLAGVAPEDIDESLPGVDFSSVLADPDARTERDEIGSLLNYTGTFHWQRILDAAPDEPQFDLTKRRMFRGIMWQNYKFTRYFAPAEHHCPEDWQTLVQNNDLELYDLSADPHELCNLAADPEAHRELIESLNVRLNTLLAREVGDDLPRDYPGPIEQYLLGS